MSLAQRSKFHVLLIGPKNSTFENRPSKGRSGTSGLNFCLGLTGVKSISRLPFVPRWAREIIFSDSKKLQPKTFQKNTFFSSILNFEPF